MIVFGVTPLFAQGALWGDVVAPLPQKELFNGLVGIGPFTAVPPFIPARMLHVHSTNIIAADGLYPAFLRLQTQVPATAEIGINQFGQTGIEFFSGSTLNGGAEWCAGKILGISNGHGLANTDQFVTPGTAEFKGGLAFFCSPLTSGSQPNHTTDQIEVMRIVEDKVGIRTKYPLGQLDVNVGDATAKPKVSITNGTTPHLDDTYGGPQLRFYIPNDNIDSPPDRSSSYSWYIHAMRQYNPACFLGLDGTQGPTWENTTLGALHFMAGYNTASHAAGDIYRDNKGSETAIPRMSLLSNGNVGINSVIPMVRFNVHNGSVLFDGEQGSTPMTRGINAISLQYEQQEIGGGTRLMWIPSKAAFRAGKVLTTEWDDVNIGLGSAAFGENNIAFGENSFVGGKDNEVNSDACVAFGNSNLIEEQTIGYFPTSATLVVAPDNSIAVGVSNEIYQSNSVAFGRDNVLNYRRDATLDGFNTEDYNSFAAGSLNDIAGGCSAAIGWKNKVYGVYAFAAGKENIINTELDIDINTGYNATAFGCHNKANGMAATVMGNESLAYSDHSVAIGYFAQAGGDITDRSVGTHTFAIGNNVKSTGYKSFTFGNNVDAEASASFALGNFMKAKTAHSGAFLIGDNSTSTKTESSQIDQITLRFQGNPANSSGAANGAYRFYTTNALNAGSYMTYNTSGWSSISDRNLKENFKEIDGVKILESIERIPASEWNYKGIPDIRYIGPMAQDFYREFHLGNDSLGINSINIDGVNMAGIQALYQRSKAQANEIQELKNTVAAFDNTLSDIALLKEGMLAQAKAMAEIQQQNSELRNRLTIVETVLNKCCTTAPGSPFGDKLHETNPTDQTIVEQNAPNPFTEQTTISFSVPATVKNAHIIIEQIGGAEMKRLPITTRGNGSIELHSENIPSGVYLYYLSADGVPTGGRKMIIIK